MPKLIRILKKHRPGCTAVKAVERGDWCTPWSTVPEKHHFGDRRGCLNGAHTTSWVQFRCNSMACTGRAIVNMDALLALAEQLGAGPTAHHPGMEVDPAKPEAQAGPDADDAPQ